MSTTSNASEGRSGPRRNGVRPEGARQDRPSAVQDRPAAAGRAPTATAPRPTSQNARTRPAGPGGAPSGVRDPRSGGSAAGVAGAPRPEPGAEARTAAAGSEVGPRQVRLTAAHINAWTVLRISFLLSVALGVVLVVAVAVVWGVLDGIGVFESVNSVIREVVGTESSFDLLELVGLSRVLSLTVVVAVINVVLLTLLATLGTVLYNLCGALVGGVRLTLTDD